MKKILMISNLISYTYNFRKEIIQAMCAQGHQVTVLADNDDDVKAKKLENMGCTLVNTPFNGKGTSIKQDSQTLSTYKKIIKTIKPDIVFSFTIKPNLYGGIAARLSHTAYAPMITGLGEVEKPGKLQKLLLAMHKFAMPHALCVFFQNKDNMEFFKEHGIKTKKNVIVPGSGVNLKEHPLVNYPEDSDGIAFAFVGRLTPAKGIEQYLDAAEYFHGKNANVSFHVAGKCDEEFRERVDKLHSSGVIVYHGLMSDTSELYAKIHCLVLPTYHPEGISNVLLESGACGRPAVCTARTGCKEVVADGINGFYCRERDSEDLIEKMEKFISLSNEERRQMGLAGRAKIEKEFDRQIVVDAYMRVLNDENKSISSKN